MSGDKKLTGLLIKNPVDSKSLIEYGRSKKLDVEDLGRLAAMYIEMVEEKRILITPLHAACIRSKPDIVKILVKEGWDVNADLEVVDSPLRIALDNGNIAVAHALVELGANTKSANCRGKTPMEAALSTNKRKKTCISAVKLLLKTGVYINAAVNVKTNQKAIHIAIINNLPVIVSYLLQVGADGNAVDMNGSTPLHIAVFNNRIEIIKLLMRHEVYLYKANKLGSTPLQSAVKLSTKETVETLITGGCDVRVDACKGVYTSLHTAVYFCKLNLVKLLFDAGADPNKLSLSGETPLHMLATRISSKDYIEYVESMQTRKDIAEFLVENGANINLVDRKRKATPLQIAVESKFLGLAKFFVKLGANVNVYRDCGGTLLHEVIPFDRDIIVNILEYGGDYNVYNKLGATPYHYAMSMSVDVKFIKCFVKHGCLYNQNYGLWSEIVNKCNVETASFFRVEMQFFMGIKENNLELIKKAVKDGAVLNSRSEEIKYPLHYVVFHGYKEVVNFLLEGNVSPNTLNDEGETALYLAAKLGDYDICRSLLRFGACYNYSSKQCPKKPATVASEFKHEGIQNLLHNIKKMFALACSKRKRVITELKSKFSNDRNEYLMYANATNNRGETLLATALLNDCTNNAQEMIKLRVMCEL